MWKLRLRESKQLMELISSDLLGKKCYMVYNLTINVKKIKDTVFKVAD